MEGAAEVLARYFRDEEPAEGTRGDLDDLRPEQAAIRLLRSRRIELAQLKLDGKVAARPVQCPESPHREKIHDWRPMVSPSATLYAACRWCTLTKVVAVSR